MIKKTKKVDLSIKNNRQREHKPHKHHQTVDSQERVDKCLTCTKSAKECKGNCWGNY